MLSSQLREADEARQKLAAVAGKHSAVSNFGVIDIAHCKLT
jgi:hypothetical protein